MQDRWCAMQVIQQQSNVTYYSFWLLTKLTYITFRLPHVQAIITGFQFAARRARSKCFGSHSSCPHEVGWTTKARNYCAFRLRIEKNWHEFCPQIFLDIEECFRFQRNTSTEKRSIFKCSKTPVARNFTSKGQAHVHCPCEKCEDRAVYPMVAWCRTRKRVRYSDANVDDTDGTKFSFSSLLAK